MDTEITENEKVIVFPSQEEIDFSVEDPNDWTVVRSFQRKTLNKRYGLDKNVDTNKEKAKVLTFYGVK